MSFISLVFGLGTAQTVIGSLALDAVLTEVIELNSDISEYAVEEGMPVSDNIRPQAERLSLSGVVTGAGAMFFAAGGGRSKMIAATESLRQIHADQIPITIVTGMGIYEGFGMSNARIARSSEGERLNIDCEFSKIRKVELQQADIPPEKTKTAANGTGAKGTGANGKAGATAAKAGKATSAAPVQEPPSKLSGLIGVGR